jgi:DNA-binding HxlR family transcriptional regulator
MDEPTEYGSNYPARQLLDLVGDKWTPIVLYSLADSVRRFSEIHRSIPDISKKMLIQVLRSLESSGLVERTVYPVVPPKTEYRLTVDGRKLHQPVAALCTWASEHEDFLAELHRRRRRLSGQYHVDDAHPGGPGPASSRRR